MAGRPAKHRIVQESVIGLFRRVRDRTLARMQSDEAFEPLLGPSALPDSVANVIPDGSSEWPVSPETGRLLARIVLGSQRRNVLEFGAGSSSLIFARALAVVGGGRLTSIESAPAWCADKWLEVAKLESVDSRLIESRPELRFMVSGPAFRFSSAERSLAARAPFDLVFVDAPQHYFGRDGAMPLAHRWLSPNALVVLDDAGREGEQYAIARWLRTYPGLQLQLFDPAFGGRGVAILRLVDRRPPRIDWWSLLTSSLHLFRRRGQRGAGERVVQLWDDKAEK